MKIDIHSHLIYGVDDGTKSVEETIKILEEAYKQGVRKMILTPHLRRNMFNNNDEDIEYKFNELKEYAKEIGIELYLGREVYYSIDILKDISNYTLANTKYILIEFKDNVGYSQMYTALNNILLEGYIPIIAHIERYDALDKKKDRILELKSLNCIMTLSAESILNIKWFKDNLKKYKKRTQYLLKEDLIDMVGSDAHNLTNRTMLIEKAYNKVCDKYGIKRAKKIFYENQKEMLESRNI